MFSAAGATELSEDSGVEEGTAEDSDVTEDDAGESLEMGESEEEATGAAEELGPSVGVSQLARSKAKAKGKKRFICN